MHTAAIASLKKPKKKLHSRNIDPAAKQPKVEDPHTVFTRVRAGVFQDLRECKYPDNVDQKDFQQLRFECSKVILVRAAEACGTEVADEVTIEFDILYQNRLASVALMETYLEHVTSPSPVMFSFIGVNFDVWNVFFSLDKQQYRYFVKAEEHLLSQISDYFSTYCVSPESSWHAWDAMPRVRSLVVDQRYNASCMYAFKCILDASKSSNLPVNNSKNVQHSIPVGTRFFQGVKDLPIALHDLTSKCGPLTVSWHPNVALLDVSGDWFTPGTFEKATRKWTPANHQHHPSLVKDALRCTLLVAKRHKWPLDEYIIHKILSYIAFGWTEETATAPCLLCYTVRDSNVECICPQKYGINREDIFLEPQLRLVVTDMNVDVISPVRDVSGRYSPSPTLLLKHNIVYIDVFKN